MDSGWSLVLKPLRPQLVEIFEMIKDKEYLPTLHNVLRIFQYPFDDVKVLIVGQDPYPTPGHAVGLSFSLDPDTYPYPPGFRNLIKEYCEDTGFPAPRTGDLSYWAERGVCLLNRVLTVAPHRPGSHAGIGWEAITEAAVEALAARDKPLVTILWGKQAQSLASIVDPFAVIESMHPSPHTAHKGFFGSKPFTRANMMLEEQDAKPIDWRLPC